MNKKIPLVSLAIISALSGCVDDGENGNDGTNGENGFNSLVQQIAIAAGDVECFNGGVQINSGLDINNNAQLDDSEILASENVCAPAINSSITSLNAMKTDFPIDTNSINLATVSFSKDTTNGNDIDLTIGFGSGAYHYPGDASNVFYTISDRGPNIDCGAAESLIGISDFCQIGSVSVKGKVFPVVDFAPSIYQWTLVENINGDRQAQLTDVITIKNASGENISGISNPLTFEDGSSNTENAFAADASVLEFDAEGIDPEALVKLSDGSFWIAEEYGASLLHISANGEVLTRVVPAGTESQFAAADYPISGDLPAIYQMRKLNRGIESIAISPNEDYLYFIMQSPLNNPDYTTSRHVRLMKYALSGGELGNMVGEYVYQLDMPETFGNGTDGDNQKAQKDVKLSEMVALAEDDLIVLERISKTTKLYRINLSSGDNIVGSDLSQTGALANESDSVKSLEDQFNLSVVGANPVSKALVFNSLVDAPSLANKVEGIAMLDSQHVMLINDNDFGISAGETEISVLKIGEQLQTAASKISAKPGMTLIGRYQASSTGEGAAEIVQYHRRSQSVFTINGDLGNRVEVVSLTSLPSTEMANPLTTTNLNGINYDIPNSVTVDGNAVNVADINSIAIYENQLAVAIAHENDITEAGVVLHYAINNDGTFNVNNYTASRVGVLPDNVAFSPDGKKIIVANEGQSGDVPANDALGSVSIIDVNNGVMNTTATTLTFETFNNAEIEGLNQNPDALDFAHAAEPEYVAVSADSKTAFITLQEINALLKVDLETKSIDSVIALGTKDHSLLSNALDASDKDNAVNIRTYENVVGLYQPDTIVSYQVEGKTYLLTANEGDAGDGFHDIDERVEDLTLDSTAFPDAASLQTDDELGRLKVVPYLGLNESNEYEKLYAFGGRSFSIWDENGKQIFDSGSDFEKITAGLFGLDFNNDEDDNDPDTRSDAKGPEPEALSVGQVGERIYAFIGFERMGGIAMYDITNPYGVQFVDYTNNRDFDNIDNGDLAPEGMTFVSAENSPTGQALVVVGNEISGTVSVYQVSE